MRLFQAYDVDEETPVQFLGVYTTRWQPEWGEPQIMFREVEDPVYEAAPDLLAACDQLVRFCEMMNMPDDLKTIEKGKAAITKAKGEQDALDSTTGEN